MIAFVEGNFMHKSPACTIVNVQGVGYEVNISLYTYDKIHQLDKGRLLTYHKVSEDSQALYGFADEVEKNIFILLISINGVGPNTARVMLSGMAPSEIAQAIANGDVKTLERVKGIGAKTAQRIVLELREKISKLNLNIELNNNAGSNNLKTDALNGLISLGIARNTATDAINKALKQNENVEDVQALLKLALKNL
jgi:holliday junction DNA helicase RuvA